MFICYAHATDRQVCSLQTYNGLTYTRTPTQITQMKRSVLHMLLLAECFFFNEQRVDLIY